MIQMTKTHFKFCRVDSDTPGYDEPKFIMFYSMLLQLFTMFCFNCKGNSPKATMRQCGTLVKVTQTCSHVHNVIKNTLGNHNQLFWENSLLVISYRVLESWWRVRL